MAISTATATATVSYISIEAVDSIGGVHKVWVVDAAGKEQVAHVVAEALLRLSTYCRWAFQEHGADMEYYGKVNAIVHDDFSRIVYEKPRDDRSDQLVTLDPELDRVYVVVRGTTVLQVVFYLAVALIRRNFCMMLPSTGVSADWLLDNFKAIGLFWSILCGPIEPLGGICSKHNIGEVAFLMRLPEHPLAISRVLAALCAAEKDAGSVIGVLDRFFAAEVAPYRSAQMVILGAEKKMFGNKKRVGNSRKKKKTERDAKRRKHSK